MRNEPWFRAKRFGYGAGLPIGWQGWLALALFIGAVLAAELLLLPAHPVRALLVVVTLAAIMVVLAAGRTEGGRWRWRWGDRT